jgi:hypothetical protein
VRKFGVFDGRWDGLKRWGGGGGGEGLPVAAMYGYVQPTERA